MMAHGVFKVFTFLSLGYVLCVLAKKQQGVLKSLGYTLGISMMVLTFALGLMMAYGRPDKICDKMSKMCGKMAKMSCPMMKK